MPWNTGQLLKKNEVMSFSATWMDLQIITLSEVNQTNFMDHLYLESKTMIQMKLFAKWKQTYRF